jgi:adenosylcobinamide-phosphate synthase
MFAMLYSAAALPAGFLLDRLLGDPHHFPHIVRLMGCLIAALEKRLRAALPADARGELWGGIWLALIMALVWTGVPLALLWLCYRLCAPVGFVLESLLIYQLLAAKSLQDESMKVYRALAAGDVEAARRDVSMIVGRDTAKLDADGIARAAVETVAENASDGVAAPLFYIMLGGAPLGCLYKAVNTMDSMVGYKNDRYLCFGRAAARLDDALNLIPSRLCALLMIACAKPLGFDSAGALRVWRRDRRRHASPNSAQTEAACAGALGVRLAGPASYFGKTADKPYIGDDTRPIRARDIRDANRLMYAASAAMLALALALRAATLWMGAAFLA